MKENYFTRKIFYRFFMPSLFSTFCLAVANLADALCVGIRMGEPALAAISLVSPIYMVFNVMDIGIAVGGSVIYARRMGEGNAAGAQKAFSQMIFLALLLSGSVAVLGMVFLEPLLLILGASPAQGAVYQMTKDYAVRLLLGAPTFFFHFLFYYFIRCDDGEKRASVGFAAANLLDVGLSFVLVLFFNAGVKGAIWATIIGNVAGILICLPHFFQKSSMLRLKLEKPDRRELASCYFTGFSTSSQYIWQFVFFLVLNNLLMRLHGESALAVFNVTLNLSYVVIGLYDGIGAAIQPMAATFYGERDREALSYTRGLAGKWGIVLGILMAAAVSLLAEKISLLFGLSAATVGMGVLAIRWYCAGSLFAGFSVVTEVYCQAVGKEKQVMKLAFLRSFLVYLVFGVLLAFGPLERFWMVFPLTEIVSLLLFRLSVALEKKAAAAEQEKLPILHRTLQNGLEEVGEFLPEVEAFCEEQEASFDQTYFVTMTVEEMCLAILQHAGEEQLFIRITLFRLPDGQFELHIRDSGGAFDPFSLRTDDITEDIDNIGILMVKKKAKEFFYRHYQGFNTLTVRV